MAQGVEHKAHNNRIQAPAFVAEVPDIPRQHRSFAETGGRIPVASEKVYIPHTCRMKPLIKIIIIMVNIT